MLRDIYPLYLANEPVFSNADLVVADFEAALDEVNDSKFGLQASMFTRDLYKLMRAWERLDVGAS